MLGEAEQRMEWVLGWLTRCGLVVRGACLKLGRLKHPIVVQCARRGYLGNLIQELGVSEGPWQVGPQSMLDNVK